MRSSGTRLRARSIVSVISGPSSTSGRSCLGRSGVLTGQNLDPTPPARTMTQGRLSASTGRQYHAGVCDEFPGEDLPAWEIGSLVGHYSTSLEGPSCDQRKRWVCRPVMRAEPTQHRGERQAKTRFVEVDPSGGSRQLSIRSRLFIEGLSGCEK